MHEPDCLTKAACTCNSMRVVYYNFETVTVVWFQYGKTMDKMITIEFNTLNVQYRTVNGRFVVADAVPSHIR